MGVLGELGNLRGHGCRIGRSIAAYASEVLLGRGTIFAAVRTDPSVFNDEVLFLVGIGLAHRARVHAVSMLFPSAGCLAV